LKFWTVWTFGPLGFRTFGLWNAPAAADGVGSGRCGCSGGGSSSSGCGSGGGADSALAPNPPLLQWTLELRTLDVAPRTSDFVILEFGLSTFKFWFFEIFEFWIFIFF
jgi:hypothetical protein